MNRGIYSTASGMISAQRAMDVTANNLANASTAGFKQDALVFGDYYTRELAVQGRRIGSMGSGAAPKGEVTNFEQGRLNRTGNSLDLALTNPQGMFAVQTPGGIQYTRDGEFSLDAQNRVVDRRGNPLLDATGNVISLDGDGPVKISASGEILQDEQPIATVGVWSGTFQKVGDNRYASTNAVPLPGETMKQGHLEGSNVEPIVAMIDMVRNGRHFEMSQKSIQTQDELTGKVIDVLRN
ncbi:MAG: flagellar hook-basal body protein [Fimbriimonas sp.]